MPQLSFLIMSACYCRLIVTNFLITPPFCPNYAGYSVGFSLYLSQALIIKSWFRWDLWFSWLNKHCFIKSEMKASIRALWWPCLLYCWMWILDTMTSCISCVNAGLSFVCQHSLDVAFCLGIWSGCGNNVQLFSDKLKYYPSHIGNAWLPLRRGS